MSRMKNWTKLTNEELWVQWRAMFNNDEEAIVTAIWISNRLVKDKEKSTRKKFYSLKDEWIAQHQGRLIIGKVVRDESRTCWTCNGTGQFPGGECFYCHGFGTDENPCDGCGNTGELPPGPCHKCNGTGKYRISILYEHLFDIDGTHYSFHSYTKPEHLCEELGADCETYGGRFTQEELDDMALPMSGLLQILAHVAMSKWEMRFDKYSGRYESRAGPSFW